MKKRGQVSVEYLVVIGFVTFAVMVISMLAFVYGNFARDRIVLIQSENIGKKIISAAEEVYYEGAPGLTSFSIYVPEQLESIEIIDNNVVISTQTSSGLNKQAFSSRVPIDGSLSIAPGIKRLRAEVIGEKVVIS